MIHTWSERPYSASFRYQFAVAGDAASLGSNDITDDLSGERRKLAIFEQRLGSQFAYLQLTPIGHSLYLQLGFRDGGVHIPHPAAELKSPPRQRRIR